MIGLVRHIAHADHDRQLPPAVQRIRHIAGERKITADMVRQLLAVDKHRRLLIDRTKMQQRFRLQKALGQRDMLSIPEKLPGQERPADAGERRFGRERYDDRAVKRLRLHIGLGDGVLPDAIEIPIAVPPQLRARIFGKNGVRLEPLTPDGL